MEKLKTLVIDRNKWGRGTQGGMLLRPDGLMCCLGFACRAAGATAAHIRLAGYDPRKDAGFRTNEIVGNIVSDAVDINDAVMEDGIREARLIKLFATEGITLSFVDGDEGEASATANKK